MECFFVNKVEKKFPWNIFYEEHYGFIGRSSRSGEAGFTSSFNCSEREGVLNVCFTHDRPRDGGHCEGKRSGGIRAATFSLFFG